VTARRMPRRDPDLTGTHLPDAQASSEDEEVSDDDVETRRDSRQGGTGAEAAGYAKSDAEASQSRRNALHDQRGVNPVEVTVDPAANDHEVEDVRLPTQGAK